MTSKQRMRKARIVTSKKTSVGFWYGGGSLSQQSSSLLGSSLKSEELWKLETQCESDDAHGTPPSSYAVF